MIVHVLQVIDGQIVLVITVVFFENGSDKFFVFISVGLGVHGLHELNETDTTSLLAIELSYDFVSGLPVRGKTILCKKQLDVVGQEYTHSCRVVGIKHFFEIEYVLIGESTCDVERWLELSEIFSFESDSINIGSVDS